MRFLYTDNNQGLFSSLSQSWLFWIVVILVVVFVFVSILKSNTNMQKTLKVEKLFGNSEDENNTNIRDAEATIDLIQDSVSYDINSQNGQKYYRDEEEAEYALTHKNNGIVPNLHKFLDADLEEDESITALPLGNAETDKSVKPYYTISAKKENIFRVVDEFRDTINFKLELRDLSKIAASTTPAPIGGIKLFNQHRKCIVMFIIDPKKIIIKSVSPFCEDVRIDLDDNTRLVAFNQVSDKLYAHNRHVATLNIYDTVAYIYVKSPIIKELQYF